MPALTHLLNTGYPPSLFSLLGKWPKHLLGGSGASSAYIRIYILMMSRENFKVKMSTVKKWLTFKLLKLMILAGSCALSEKSITYID